MIVQCTSCAARYHYEESRFGSAGVKRIRCTKCATIFEIQNPHPRPEAGGPAAPAAGGPAANTLADDLTLDVTAMGSGPRKRLLPTDASASGQMPRLSAFRPVPTPDLPRGSTPKQVTALHGRPSSGRPPTEAKRLKLPDRERLSLACIAGPDSGKIFEIEKPRVVIGRANADILLSDGECSRQHAAIEVFEDRALLTDLNSTNGTFARENRVTELELSDKSEFDVGASTLMFIRSIRD